MNKKTTITWLAPEFRDYEKTAGWYVTLISLTILIVGFFIVIQKDIFAAAVIGIISLLIVYFSRLKPEIIPIEIDNKSISYKNIIFPFKQIRHFWIVHNHSHKTLNLETTALLNNLIILELVNQDPEEIRQFLKEYISEHEDTAATPIQKFIHWVKF